MDNAQRIAYGLQDMALENKAALRARIWFAFGYHMADDTGAFVATLRRAIDPDGSAKGKASMACKTTRTVGDKFGALFAAQLASNYASEADKVQACFIHAMASGATTVQRLEDWAKHGDADYTANAKAADAKAKADEKQDVATAEQADIANAEISPLGFDAAPEVIAAPEADAAPDAASDTLADRLADMDDAEFAALVEAVTAEKARRIKAQADAKAA